MKRLLTVGGLIGVALLTGCVSNFKEQDAVSLSEQNLSSLNASQDTSQVLDGLKNSVQTLIAARSCIETGTCAVDPSVQFRQIIAFTREVASQLKQSNTIVSIDNILRSNNKKFKISKTFKNPEFLQMLQDFGFSEDDIKDMKKLLKKNEKLIRQDIQINNTIKLLEDTVNVMESRLNEIQPNPSNYPLETLGWEWYKKYLAPEVRWFSSCMRSFAWTGFGAFLYGATLGSAYIDPTLINVGGVIYGARGVIQNTRETIKICVGW